MKIPTKKSTGVQLEVQASEPNLEGKNEVKTSVSQYQEISTCNTVKTEQ